MQAIRRAWMLEAPYGMQESSQDPTTRATEISTLTSCGQCYAPKRYARYTPTQAYTASGISFRFSSVPHGQGRISFASPLKSSLNPSTSSASLWLSFATLRTGEEMSLWLTPQCLRFLFFFIRRDTGTFGTGDHFNSSHIQMIDTRGCSIF